MTTASFNRKDCVVISIDSADIDFVKYLLEKGYTLLFDLIDRYGEDSACKCLKEVLKYKPEIYYSEDRLAPLDFLYNAQKI